MGRRPRDKSLEKELALSQVKAYFERADEAFISSPGLADRYVTLARKTAMKYQVTIPGPLKRKFCRHCYRYLRPGVTSRVRTSASGGGKIVSLCMHCGNHIRHPYLRERKERRAGQRKTENQG